MSYPCECVICAPINAARKDDVALRERVKALEAALRDECIDHPDGCRCRPCGLVFAPTKEGT